MGKIDKIHSSGRYQVVRRGTVYAIDRPRCCLNVRSYAHARLSLSLSLFGFLLFSHRHRRRRRRGSVCMRLCHGLSPPFPCATSISLVPCAARGSLLKFSERRPCGSGCARKRATLAEREREREREGLLRADCDAAMHKATFVSARLPRFLRLSRRFVIREIGLLAADLP